MEKKKISARIVADSVSPQGHRITTFVLTYPRIIHAEVMTHRMFSRNAASSRAIPFKKMVEDIENDPFIPIAWQKDHKGMQGDKYETDPYYIEQNESFWLNARDMVCSKAKVMNLTNKVTKQLCNRLLEPFQWYTCLVTATEFDNFYKLRCPKFINEHEEGEDVSFSRKDFIKKLKERYPTNWESDLKDFYGIENNTEEEWFSLSESGAEIHIQALAEAMWDAQNESTPRKLKPGEWHIPFGDKILISWKEGSNLESNTKEAIKIATARCARLSYMTFDGEIDYEKDIALHDRLLADGHMSPFEHCARAMTIDEYMSFIKGQMEIVELDEPNDGEIVAYNKVWNDEPEAGWCNNFKGFVQYRYLIENGIN